MTDVKIRVPSGIPEKIAKFELERELERKKRKMKSLKSSIEKLDLSEKDKEKFEEAREKAWQKRKNIPMSFSTIFCQRPFTVSPGAK